MSDELPLEIEVLEFVDLRTQGVETDFEIRVGEEAYKTHQQTLMKHSGYFRGILNGENSVEKQQRFVNVEDVTGKSVEVCLNYLYTGKFSVEDQIVLDVLHAAEMFQISKLEDFCYELLEQAVTALNCISMYSLSKEKQKPHLADKAQTLFAKTFNFGEVDHFFQLSAQEIKDFVQSSKIGNELLWTAIISWIEHDRESRKDVLPNLIALMHWEEFPSETFLKELWENPLFIGSEICKAQVFKSLFMDLEKLEKNLSVKNFFIVHKIASAFLFLMKLVEEFLCDFLALNVIELFQKSEFLLLEEKVILQLYQNKAFKYVVPEEWRWIVAMKWVEFDSHRQKNFSQILRTFCFKRMAGRFLEEHVLKDLSKLNKESSTIFIKTLTSSIAQQWRMNIVLRYSDDRICIYDGIKGAWEQPAGKYHVGSNLKLKGKGALFRGPTGSWKELPTTQAIHLTGFDNAPNDALTVKAFIFGEIEEEKVFDGSYSHVFLVGMDIIGLSKTEGATNGSKCHLLHIGTFNRNSKRWEKNLWNKTLGYFQEAQFVVTGFSTYICFSKSQCGYSHSVLKLTHLNGKIFETKLPQLENVFYGTQIWLLNVDGRVVALTSSKSVYSYDEMSKKWVSLPEPPQSSRPQHSNKVDCVGGYSFCSVV